MTDGTPDYLLGTAQMVKNAFSGMIIEEPRRMALIELLREGECSDRSIAQVLSVADGTGRSCEECLYEVSHIQRSKSRDICVYNEVRGLLRANGYDLWIHEE
jgi:hypothetical protein